MLVEGTVLFRTYLTQFEEFQGKVTDKHSIQVRLDGKTASSLAKAGVKVKEFDGEPMRKFTTRYNVDVFGVDKKRFTDEIPSGSKVRVEYIQKTHPQHGEIPYLKRVLILELAENEAYGDPAFFKDEETF